MKTNFFVLLIITVTFLISCDDDSAAIPQEGDLFPLAIGNRWEYEQPAYAGSHELVSVNKEITDKVKLEGREYYQMITTWKSSPDLLFTDTAYYRIDDFGFVYERRTTGAEANPYRLHAADNESWKYSSASTGNDMHVIYQEFHTISGTEIKNTRSFSFDIPSWIDEEWCHVLAPGIGVVKFYYMMGQAMILKTAVINGEKFQF